jgi:hypothetical protein
MVEAMGWAAFFFLTTVTALPGLGMLFVLRRQIVALTQDRT